MTKSSPHTLNEQLALLKLIYMRDNHEPVSKIAASKHWTHVNYLSELVDAEVHLRSDRAIQRRIAAARFAQIKTIEQFDFTWPKKIDRLSVENLFRLAFIKEKSNVILIGGVGLGKTHLATALGYQACLGGHSVLFATAVDAVNNLVAAQKAGRLKHELAKYHKPALLILDELGYLPIDKIGADMLFQIISKRYEQGTIIITCNRAFKDWSQIFNNDSTLTSALLDRLLHHAETEVIEGKSYRMRDIIEKEKVK
jgi:DNA replication protein DnaC